MTRSWLVKLYSILSKLKLPISPESIAQEQRLLPQWTCPACREWLQIPCECMHKACNYCNCWHCIYIYLCINFRLITRVVLVPFVTPAYSRTPMEQDQLDTMLASRMQEAGRGAGVVVRVGAALLSSPTDLNSIMRRVAECIPSAKPRVHSSYSLLMLCTLKVRHMCSCSYNSSQHQAANCFEIIFILT